jgi:MerR family mercuric resistance operon transcriptional regulator
MTDVTIAGLARAGGVGVETIRYYQRRGLLRLPVRGAGIRRYDGEDLRRLRFVRAAQAAGFTLDQIAELLALDATEDRARARELARDRIAALDARIAELKAARDALARLERDCRGGAAGPCPILQAFDTAGHPHR